VIPWMLAMLLTLTMLQPVVGSATRYDTGLVTRNGQAFDQSAMTCSVDDRLFERLVGKTLVVCNAGDYCILCTVADSGYLDEDEQVSEQFMFVDLTPAAFWELRRGLTAAQDNDGRLPVTIFVIP